MTFMNAVTIAGVGETDYSKKLKEFLNMTV